MCSVGPLVVQLPAAENATGSVDVAVAATAKSASPNVFAAGASTRIDWLAFAIANVRETAVAALYVESPACEAVSVQLPALVSCTVLPLSVQVPLAARDGGRPEDAPAAIAKLASPNV